MDGWEDFIRIDFPGEGAYWYRNPQHRTGYWDRYMIDDNACNESPMFVDIDGDGRKDLVFGHESDQTMMWFKSPESPDDLNWKSFALSKKNASGTKRYSHGLGFGDVNLDGRKDIVTRHGWWEAPENRTDVPWAYHAADFGKPCSQMYVYDFDKDGIQDVISASAHAYGIWWYKRGKTDVDETVNRTLIDSSFSQTHAVAFADMNEDGLPDLVTGKRFFAHHGKDPGGLEPAVLKWFELGYDGRDQPVWTIHEIDDNSGVGLQVVVEDLNGDGKLDIINSNKKGVIVFYGK